MSDFRFVAGAYEAQSRYQDDQICLNWYPEIDAAKNPGERQLGVAGDRGVIALYPTPGLLLLQTLDSGSGVRGLHPLPGGQKAVAVSGSVVYLLTTSFIATRIGTIGTSSGPVSITDNGNAIFMADGSNRYYSMINNCVFNGTISTTTLTVNSVTSGSLAIGMSITGTGVTAGTVITAGSGTSWTVNNSQSVGSEAMTATPNLTTVTDGAFTASNTVDVVDNYVVYNNPNSNQWGCTDVGAVTSNGLNFGSTLTAPGNVIGLITNQRQVFLMSEYTTEVWGDAESYPFPFQIIPGTSMQHGCAARGSIARLGEGFAFLAQDSRGNATVVLMNGYSPIRISTHAIEYAIQGYSTISDAIAFTYQENGHEFYVLTFPTADATWVFDLATEMWHQRGWMDNRGVMHRHRANCMMNFANKIIVGDWQTGNLYQMSTTTYTDNGQTIKRVRRAPHLTSDLKRMFFHDLQIQFQPGIGLQSGQGSSPQAMLRWSNDGGSTWSAERWTTIGSVGQYKNRAIWRRLGSARDRVFEVTVTDPINAVIVSANLNATAGAS